MVHASQVMSSATKAMRGSLSDVWPTKESSVKIQRRFRNKWQARESSQLPTRTTSGTYHCKEPTPSLVMATALAKRHIPYFQ
ncbi:MAG: hypothetical protein HYU39_02690 [Thaumarchaeota archaeon]|nr:hypothetical protein [Nitrososphaerota archaeon]